jgi:hypothetical protein
MPTACGFAVLGYSAFWGPSYRLDPATHLPEGRMTDSDKWIALRGEQAHRSRIMVDGFQTTIAEHLDSDDTQSTKGKLPHPEKSFRVW